MSNRTQQLRAGFWGIDLLLTAATVYFLVKAVQYLLIYPAIPPEPLDGSTSSRFAGNQPRIRPYEEFSALRKSDLFGALSSSNVAARAVIKEELPQTTLELELLGCVAGSEPEASFAIIRDKRSRKEDTYSVGDFVSDARVEEIRTTEVVISRAGRREVLAMLFDESKRSAPFGRLRDRSPRPIPSATPETLSAPGSAIRVVNDRLRQINREKLMLEVKNNLGSLMSQVRTSPNMVDNKPSGINIESIGSDPLMEQAGLKPGDIVKSVNGLRVNSVDDILASADRLQNAPEIRVVIERDGRHTTLVYKIR